MDPVNDYNSNPSSGERTRVQCRSRQGSLRDVPVTREDLEQAHLLLDMSSDGIGDFGALNRIREGEYRD